MKQGNAKGDPGGSPSAVTYAQDITRRHVSIFEALAEGVGFEPTRRLRRPPVFKTGAFNRSATPPRGAALRMLKVLRPAQGRLY
jgi:hypothetical protein